MASPQLPIAQTPQGGPGSFLAVPFSDILLLFIISFGFSLFGDDLLLAIIGERIERETTPSSGQYLLYLFLSLIVDLLAIRFLVLKRHALSWRDLGLRHPKPGTVRLGILVGLLALPLTTLIEAIVSQALPIPDLGEQRRLLVGDAFSHQRLVLLLSLLGFANPIVQELLFRGVALNWLKSRLGLSWALLLVSLFYAAAHGWFFFLPSLTILGVIYGLLSQRGGSLWPAIAAHSTYSCFQILVAFQTLGVPEIAAS